MSVVSIFYSEPVGPAARGIQADQPTEMRSDLGIRGTDTRGVGVGLVLTTSVRLASPTPGGHGLLVHPQSETPAEDQRLAVLGPVPDTAWSLVLTVLRVRCAEAGQACDNLRRLHS